MRELGNWITAGTEGPFLARREFAVEKPVARATAKVCGLGQFVFWVNGQKVGDHELDPGWTDYRKYIEYVTFDVTALLRPGKNALGAEVGNGWFLKNDEHYTFSFPAFMPPNPNPYRPFGKSLVLALELNLLFADGTSETLRADGKFRVAPHSVTQSNVYGSETEDGRLRQAGWALPGFDDSGWAAACILPEADAPAGRLLEQFQPPIRVVRKYPAKFLHTVNGREIYDFGQNTAGILSFEAKGRPGDVVRIYPAEKLAADGDVDQVAKGWVTVDSVVTYILGAENAWEPFRMRFTYFAGKVVAVEKSPGVELRGLAAEAVTSAWQEAGSFSCDDARYEAIYSMIERTVEANLLSVHTDCPTIERFAWQEPNHLMAPAIFFMKDGRKLWEKFLLDMRSAQHTGEDFFFDYAGEKVYPGDGLVPSQCPCYIPNVLPVPGMGSFYDIVPWGSSIILAARWHYLFYGDRRILEENFDAGLRYLEHLKTKMTPEGFLNHGLGDWGNPENVLARENIETVFLYADASTLAWFAKILGREAERKDLLAFAEEVRENYNRRLLVRDGDGRWQYRVWGDGGVSQAAEALPLYWGMVPDERRADVIACFRRTLTEKGAFAAGEIGLPYIIQTASKNGMNDLVAEFLLREEHSSYYAFLLDGMTTLGEYLEHNPRSHCHDMMGHIVEWYYTGIAGIEILEPGFRKVRVRPYLPPTVSRFRCTYRSPLGEIEVCGARENGRETFTVRVPDGMALEEGAPA